MTGITQAQAESQLATWLSAAEKIAVNQSYTIQGRTYTRANLADVQSQIEFWDKQVKRLSRGGLRMTQVTPVSN